MNPRSKDTILYKGTHAATIERVDLVPEVQPISLEDTSVLNEKPVKVNKFTDVKLEPELEKLYEEIECPLNETEKLTGRKLLQRNKEAKDGPLRRTDLVKHDIDTTNRQPIKQRAHRFPIHQREERERQVEEMLKEIIKKPSTSPWASPVVLVKKKNGETLFCIDYHKLNMVSVKDAHPLPHIDNSLDALSRAKCFSTLDLASGYWHDRASQTPSTFESRMETVFAGLTLQICLVY